MKVSYQFRLDVFISFHYITIGYFNSKVEYHNT